MVILINEKIMIKPTIPFNKETLQARSRKELVELDEGNQ